MPEVLHILDDDAPAEVLDQLALMEQGRRLCIGPKPAHRAAATAEVVHAPLRSKRWAAFGLPVADPTLVQAVHAWSEDLLEAAAQLAYDCHCPLVVTLAAAPRGEPLERLLKCVRQYEAAPAVAMRSRRMAFTVPAGPSRDALLEAGVGEEVVHVVPPAATAARDLPARRAAVRERLGLTDADVLMVAPAEMSREAGHRCTIWAHAILRHLLDNVKLLLPRGGPWQQHVEYFATTTGFENDILLPHRMQSAEGLADALAAADVATFLATADGSISSLTAALANGCAIVASDTPDTVALLGGPATPAALLVPRTKPRQAASAVLRLLEDLPLRRQVQQHALERAKAFDAAAVGQQLQALYA